jgi:hypothetical protein
LRFASVRRSISFRVSIKEAAIPLRTFFEGEDDLDIAASAGQPGRSIGKLVFTLLYRAANL